MTVQLFEVGGKPRDEILGIESNDLDYVAVVDGGWKELQKWTEENLDRVFLVTPEYLTIRGLKGKDAIDIVMARKDGEYSDGRHPDSVEPGTLEDDLLRRDFTMNAMARSVDTGELYDPTGGRRDIENRVIRCVGDASARLKEDGLRIIRALRFAVTKEMALDEELATIIRSDSYGGVSPVTRGMMGLQGLRCPTICPSTRLRDVSTERIREELHKMFSTNTIASGFLLFNEDFVHPEILMSMFHGPRDLWMKPSMEKI